MKRFNGLSIVVMATLTCCAAVAWGQQPDVQSTDNPRPANASGEPELGAIQRASYLIGCEVMDSRHESLGRIADIALDLPSGRIAALIVERQDGDKQVQIPLPPSIARLGVMTVVADVTPEKLRQAPTFGGESGQPLTRAGGAKVFKHFEQPVPWKQEQAERPLALVSQIRELPIASAAGKRLGRIDDFALLLDKGLIGYAAVSVDEDAAQLFPVPLSAFVVTPEVEHWVLELPKDILAQTPRFNANAWPDKIDRAWVEYVHVRYGRSPFAGVREVLHAENRNP